MKLAVDLAAVPYLDDLHYALCVVYRVQNAVIPLANAVEVCARKFLAALGAGLQDELVDSVLQQPDCLAGKVFKLALGASSEDEAIRLRHAQRRLE